MGDTQTLVQQYPQFVALFLIVLILAVTFGGFLLLQNRKMQEMQKPKFGFLGKPITAFALGALLIGGFGIAFTGNLNTNTNVDVSVSEEIVNVNLNIVSTQTNQFNNTYQFNIVPELNGVEWGKTGDVKLDIIWSVSNSTIKTDVEKDISKNNTGGVEFILQQGTNRINAKVTIQNKVYEKEIDVYID
jgi:hypothetical protein